MESFVHADIFFFITSIAIIVVSTFVAVICIYVVGILRDIKNISHRARKETEFLAQDIADFRTKVREDGAKIRHFVSFFKRLHARGSARKKRSGS